MVSLKAVPADCVPGFESVKVLAAAGETVKLVLGFEVSPRVVELAVRV